jgi:hypothetical protein
MAGYRDVSLRAEVSLAQNTQEDFHEIFPLMKWSVNCHRDSQQRAEARR